MAILEDELGDVVAKARIGNGLTVERLAEATGLRPVEISDIEAYRLKPDTQVLGRLAEVLCLDVGKLAAIASDEWAPTPVDLAGLGIVLAQVPVPHGNYRENSYIFACPTDRAAAIVDPGGAVDEIARTVDELELRPQLVLVTHAHADHIGGLKDVAAHWPDVQLVNHQLERDSAAGGLRLRWEAAKDSVSFQMGSLSITPLSTPGHTPGSTCYLVDGVCFVGDTLFAGSIGRLGQGNAYKEMLAAIRTKILSLPPDTILLPGHGPATTVAEERAHNPFF